MILKELVADCDFDEIASVLKDIDGEDVDLASYLQVLERLLYMQGSLSKFQIVIRDFVTNGFEYRDVYGCIVGDNESYALEFQPWSEWLGMEINKESLVRFSHNEIVGYCLHEMTTFGYDEEKIKSEYEKIIEYKNTVLEDEDERKDNDNNK